MLLTKDVHVINRKQLIVFHGMIYCITKHMPKCWRVSGTMRISLINGKETIMVGCMITVALELFKNTSVINKP